ncbi:uncharacterized protein LOC134574554 [Pelobates fuscus]|uniref:uncharacterized protein LOC134574554 n=1 Tax=Pelobates fuscus TaxID=191477 RepID=UPI002FE488AA
MPRCLVRGCRNSHIKSADDFSFHRFPKQHDRIKEWLLATGDRFQNIDIVIRHIMHQKKASYLRICSDHFAPEMFSLTPKRKTLNSDAVPTIFPRPSVLAFVHEFSSQESISDIEMDYSTCVSDVSSIQSDPPDENATVVYDHSYVPSCCYTLPLPKKKCNRETNTYSDNCDKCVSTSQYCGRRNASTQTKGLLWKRDASTVTFDLIKKRDIWTWTGIPEEPAETVDRDTSTRVSKKKRSRGHGLNNSAETMSEEMDVAASPSVIEPPTSGENLFTQVSQIPPVRRESDTESTLSATELNDPDFSPEVQAIDLGELSFVAEPTPEDNVLEKKFIVFERCLDELLQAFQTCALVTCPAPIIHREKVVTGTLLTVYTICECNHRCEFWKSQPMIGSQACGNILASASVLFSGLHFAKVNEFFSIFGVPFISQALHYYYQKKYLFPTVNLHYVRERNFLIDSLKGKALCLSGDGQCDNLGRNAKFCTYSLLEESTQKIIECNIVQVSETTSTAAVESKAFTQCMDQVLAEGLTIATLVTNRHVRIRKIMKEKYKKINHQFDVWHYCKNLHRKLASLTKQSIYHEIAPWQKSIINHMWAACASCRGNPELLREKWNSVLHHIINEHEWNSGALCHRCEHAELFESDDKKRKWIQKTGLVYSKLDRFVNDTRLQKDLPHMADFCDMGTLEDFHSLLSKYHPKNVRFTVEGMAARTKLAVLAHNANADRKPPIVHRARKSNRQVCDLRYRPYFSRSTKTWHNKKKRDVQAINHIYPMVADVIRFAAGELDLDWVSQRRGLPPNIAYTPWL